jgi:hypothetical protein
MTSLMDDPLTCGRAIERIENDFIASNRQKHKLV